MSALARIVMQKGAQVQGTDCTASPILEQLATKGRVFR